MEPQNTDTITSVQTLAEKTAVAALLALDTYEDSQPSYDESEAIDVSQEDYYDLRADDTLAGWSYSMHPRSICLTPPDAWRVTPITLNVIWYKRPLFYSHEHKGYFINNAEPTVSQVETLGAIRNQDRVWA